MGLQNLSFHFEIFTDSKINKKNKIFYSDFFVTKHTKPDEDWHSIFIVMLATRDNHGINPLDCFHLGVHRVLLSGHIHCRNQSQNPSTRLRFTSGKLLEKYVEHHGFCCGSYGVSFICHFLIFTGCLERI